MSRLVAVLMVGVVVAGCSGAPHPNEVAFDGMDAEIYRGADHCGWENTWYLWVGSQDLRSHFSSDHDELFTQAQAGGSPWVIYVRDPDQIAAYEYQAQPLLDTGLQPEATLVATSGRYELWVDPFDPHHLFVDNGTTIEGWVLATQSFGCE